MSLNDLAHATPAHRDRVIDFIRAGSLAVVILGHWLMATVVVTEGGIRGSSALAELPWATPLTWLLQVMPLFFVAGGFANLMSWRSVRGRHGGYATYAYLRIGRLIRPTLVFVTAVPVVLFALSQLGFGDREVALAGRLLAQPLWFLAVYVLVTALAPVCASWHARRPVAAVACLGLLAVAADVVRFLGYPPIGYLNFGFVWLFAQQLGFWYAGARRPPRWVLWTFLGGSLGVLTALTGPGPYPLSMVGQPGEMSNMNPPTVCLLVLTVGQVAALLLLRPRLDAWLERSRPWLAVVLLGSMAMTLYLWHLLVLVVGFAVVLWLGVPLPEPGSPTWWMTRPVWCAALAAVLAALAVRLAPIERRDRREHCGDRSVVLAVAGVLAASAGLFGAVLGGLASAVSVVLSVVAMATGLALSRGAVSEHRVVQYGRGV